MAARQERRPQGGNTNRSDRSLHPEELRGSAPPSSRLASVKPTPRSDGRPTPRTAADALARAPLELSHSLPGSSSARAPLGSGRRVLDNTLDNTSTSKDGERFARTINRFTPEQRARQRSMMAEIRNRVEVRNVDVRNAFRELDEDKSGSVDVSEFVNVLRKAHIELPPADAQLLFAFGDSDGSGRVSYDEFCKALERTGPWGSRFYGLEGTESDEHVKHVVEKYAKKEFAAAMGARIAQGSAGRMRYYHMLDRDADGYVSKEDFIQGSRKLNMARETEGEVNQFFRELADLQGGEGRLNFPLFGELLTPLPDLKGTGPFGGDYRLAEIDAVRRRARDLDDTIRSNPLMDVRTRGALQTMRTWQFEPGPANSSAPGVGPLLALSKSAGALPSPRALRASVEPVGKSDPRRERSIDAGTYEIADAPLPERADTHLLPQRHFAPRRSGQPAFARGTHANVIEPVSESSMFQTERARLVRPAHFADKWDSAEDARRKSAVVDARARRAAGNEGRISLMVTERQATAELLDHCRSRALGRQALWLMERTAGQM